MRTVFCFLVAANIAFAGNPLLLQGPTLLDYGILNINSRLWRFDAKLGIEFEASALDSDIVLRLNQSKPLEVEDRSEAIKTAKGRLAVYINDINDPAPMYGKKKKYVRLMMFFLPENGKVYEEKYLDEVNTYLIGHTKIGLYSDYQIKGDKKVTIHCIGSFKSAEIACKEL